jgi:hypothetical protein
MCLIHILERFTLKDQPLVSFLILHLVDIPSVVKLAGQLYNQRILEIKALIRKDEERFRALVAELDDIRQGKWDDQLEEELKKNPPPPEPEHESEPSTNEAEATSSTETSQHPQQDSEPLQIDTTAPSSLSSPVSSTLSEKPEDAGLVMQEDTSEVEQPVTFTTSSAEGASEIQTGSEQKDVEMEEVGEPESTSQTPAVSASTPVASSNTPAASNVDEDVEMEDITSTDSPSVVSETLTPVEAPKSATVQDGGSNLKKLEADTGSIASSPTSASDLSPPGAMEEEEDEDEDEEELHTPKKEPVSSSPAVDKAMDDSEIDEADQAKEVESVKEEADKKADEEENEEADKDDAVGQELEPDSRNTPDDSSEAGDDSKVNEDVVIKSEDAMNDTEQEDDAAKDGQDEGVTSADDDEEEEEEGEEEAVTKSPRKPRKIKTSVPVKRKRRSGRGGADVEDSYNSSDSEATESVSNMSDQRNQMDDKKWKKILMMIWTDIANHRFGAVFMQPIKEHDAPGYYYMIKRPMDLKSIKERIRDGVSAFIPFLPFICCS